MPLTPTGYQRRNSLRHPAYDYTQSGAYFVTICTHRGNPLFGQINEQTMSLSPLGQIAEEMWLQLLERQAHVNGDTFVVMPNHVHFLVWLTNESALTINSTDRTNRKFGGSVYGSLSTLIGAYKGSVTQRARRAFLIPGPRLWQRNYYDHIVRNEADAQRIREYILANPARWSTDQLHPKAEPNRFNRTWSR